MEGEEIWKDIPEYEGYYQVSNLGRVKRIKHVSGKAPDVLKPGNTYDYRYVNLCIHGKTHNIRVHKLVMLAFVGVRPEGMEINHKNGVKDDNRLSNLEYVTPHENIRHAVEVLGRWDSRRKPKPQRPARAKLTFEAASEIRRMVASGEKTQKELAAIHNVDKATISRIISGQAWNRADDGGVA